MVTSKLRGVNWNKWALIGMMAAKSLFSCTRRFWTAARWREPLWKCVGCRPPLCRSWRAISEDLKSKQQQNSNDVAPHQNGETFADLFRNSNFVRVGNPVGKEVEGEIIAVEEDNLYVDFGSKFHAVVPLPAKSLKEEYRRGTKVRVLVRDLELTGHFLGQSKHLSLLEAEAELVGLAKP